MSLPARDSLVLYKNQPARVVLDGDCVRLTERGQRLASFSRGFRQHLLPRRRVLLGRETDELLDPFRNGVTGEGDSCLDPRAQASVAGQH